MLNIIHYSVQFSSVQSLSHVRLFATPWIAARQASLSITNSQSSLKLMSIESVMPSSHLILCPLRMRESFPMSQLFTWSGQSTGVSALALFLPKNTQDWSPLEWTDWLSLQSKGLSRVFSNTTVQKHKFFGTQLSSQSNSHIHTWLERYKSEPQWSITSDWSQWSSSKILQTINVGESLEKRELSCILCGIVNWYSNCGEQCGESLEN